MFTYAAIFTGSLPTINSQCQSQCNPFEICQIMSLIKMLHGSNSLKIKAKHFTMAYHEPVVPHKSNLLLFFPLLTQFQLPFCIVPLTS